MAGSHAISGWRDIDAERRVATCRCGYQTPPMRRPWADVSIGSHVGFGNAGEAFAQLAEAIKERKR